MCHGKVPNVCYVEVAKCHVPSFGDRWYVRTRDRGSMRYYAEGACRRFKTKRAAEEWLRSVKGGRNDSN